MGARGPQPTGLVRKTLFVDPKVMERAKSLAEFTGVPTTELLRGAMAGYVALLEAQHARGARADTLRRLLKPESLVRLTEEAIRVAANK